MVCECGIVAVIDTKIKWRRKRNPEIENTHIKILYITEVRNDIKINVIKWTIQYMLFKQLTFYMGRLPLDLFFSNYMQKPSKQQANLLRT